MKRLTVDDVECLADESDDDVTIEFNSVKVVTSKAVKVRAHGEDFWIPFSQISGFWPDDKEIQITAWIAAEKGLD